MYERYRSILQHHTRQLEPFAKVPPKKWGVQTNAWHRERDRLMRLVRHLEDVVAGLRPVDIYPTRRR